MNDKDEEVILTDPIEIDTTSDEVFAGEYRSRWPSSTARVISYRFATMSAKTEKAFCFVRKPAFGLHANHFACVVDFDIPRHVPRASSLFIYTRDNGLV